MDEMELGEMIFDPEDPEDASDYPIEGEGGVEKRCTLCLGGRRDETATECGHVCKSLPPLPPSPPSFPSAVLLIHY